MLIDGEGDAAAVEKSEDTYAVLRTDTPWIFTSPRTSACVMRGIVRTANRRSPARRKADGKDRALGSGKRP